MNIKILSQVIKLKASKPTIFKMDDIQFDTESVHYKDYDFNPDTIKVHVISSDEAVVTIVGVHRNVK